MGCRMQVGLEEIAVLSLYLASMFAVKAATGQVLSTRSLVDHGTVPPQVECDTSLVVSDGVDCGRRRRNVYDKKPQRYAKNNRTAHLTARSDKSVSYVNNNKRLYSTFCTVTTDRHEVTRGLFATAELLVFYMFARFKICEWIEAAISTLRRRQHSSI